MEIWKDIKDYEGIYQASTLGRIRSLDRIVIRKLPGKTTRICNQKGKIINPIINKGTRKGVRPRYELRLSKNGITKGYQIHRLIALTFLTNNEQLEVNHKDGNSLNNKLDNLELITRLENIRHAFVTGLINTSHPIIKKDANTGEIISEYYSVSEGARSISMSQGSLRFHLSKHTTKPYKGYVWEYK